MQYQVWEKIQSDKLASKTNLVIHWMAFICCAYLPTHLRRYCLAKRWRDGFLQ